MEIEPLQRLLLQEFALLGLKNTLKIAYYCEMTQSTVYRSLYGRPKRLTNSLKKLCYYAKVEPLVTDPQFLASPIITSAVQAVWDGTEEHAQHISDLIRHVYSSTHSWKFKTYWKKDV